MNFKIYKQLNKDLENLKLDNQNEFYLEIENLIKEIDTLDKVYDDKIIENDIKIIVARNYINKMNVLANARKMDYSKKEIKDLEYQVSVYQKYFETEEEAKELSNSDNYSFENIREAQKTINFVTQKRNSFSTLFNTLGVFLIFIWFIHTIILAANYYDFSIILLVSAIYLFVTLVMFGFAGVFQLLHDIRKKLYIKK